MGCLALSIAGGIFEVVGLGLVALEIGRMQREEFGRPILLARLEAWVRRLIRRPKNQTVHLHAQIRLP